MTDIQSIRIRIHLTRNENKAASILLTIHIWAKPNTLYISPTLRLKRSLVMFGYHLTFESFTIEMLGFINFLPSISAAGIAFIFEVIRELLAKYLPRNPVIPLVSYHIFF